MTQANKNNGNKNIFPGASSMVPTSTVSQNQHSTSPGGPPIPLGRTLSLLWALYGQLRLLTCPNSCVLLPSPLLKLDRSQLWKICYLFRYSTDLPSWSWGFNLWLGSWMGRFPFLFLSFTLGVQLWFGHSHWVQQPQTPFPCPVSRSESSR